MRGNKDLRNIIFKMCLKIAETNEIPDFTMSDVDRALSSLKNRKSKDPEGLVIEMFKN